MRHIAALSAVLLLAANLSAGAAVPDTTDATNDFYDNTETTALPVQIIGAE